MVVSAPKIGVPALPCARSPGDQFLALQDSISELIISVLAETGNVSSRWRRHRFGSRRGRPDEELALVL